MEKFHTRALIEILIHNHIRCVFYTYVNFYSVEMNFCSNKALPFPRSLHTLGVKLHPRILPRIRFNEQTI